MNITMLFFGASLFVTVGDLLLAQWARGDSWNFLFIGLVLNLIGIGFYAQTLRLESVGIATAIFLGINIFAVALSGFLFFGQSYTTRESVGLILLVLAIVLIEI